MSFPIPVAVCSLVPTVTGLVVNAFITLVNIRNYLREQGLKPCDKILMALCLTRFLLQWTFLLDIIGILLQLIPFSTFAIYCIFYVVEQFLDYFSRWLAMWLSILYYVNITIFKNVLVLYLKSRIPHVTSYMIFVSAFLSFGPGLIYSLTSSEVSCLRVSNQSLSKNATYETKEFLSISFVFGQCLPSVIEMVSSIYLLWTLFAHVNYTKANVSSFTAPNMDAHWSAIRCILLLYFMSACNFIGNLILYFFSNDSFGSSLSYIITFAYPTLHSVVFVLNHSKLKKELAKILYCEKSVVGFRAETVVRSSLGQA
ncbi:bitter taste receptor 5 [Xenopus tropicalis]|uniref:Taste receptor type 2 n=1 Tax=Xenopus tropicalis TaxID=8364 RepID=Q2AB76_XENTR|nr:bitter taste receptor 5 [Xenopus tropicalis]BAE80391.1 bitter taste receptor [Xenopus tropicalis]|eukprot:NP_001165468.1 bitter taste receptor 5 [Xenopus tropicalis]